MLSIITPSYNMLGYLKRCCASVADQKDVSFEHIVVDALSNDGSAEWLNQNKKVTSVIEKDRGMYDAVNKGLLLAKGEVISYLNCDEQYLPGTLSFVQDYFERHPDVDIVFGDALLIKPDGSLISYRKGYQPRWFYVLASHLYVLSCTMFVRRKIISHGFSFDDRLRDVGDADFVVRLLRHGYRATHAKRYLAAFTMTGNNMSAGENARSEMLQHAMTAPLWVRYLRHPVNAARLVEKAISGAYWQAMPLEYSVYGVDSTSERKAFNASEASFRWRFE